MYTAANTYPIKIVRNPPIRDGKYYPLCVQLWLTNSCNLSCPYCATKERNLSDELAYKDIENIAEILMKIGTKAVVISGGGEATLHPQVDNVIRLFAENGLEIGLITNGLTLKQLSNLSLLTWCRISFDDYRCFEKEKNNFHQVMKVSQNVDWAFSYLITPHFRQSNFETIIDFVQQYEYITHCRITSDVFNPINFENFQIPPRCIIRDAKQNVSRGQNPCYMSIAKPLIAANGNIYGCCEVFQYLGFSEKTTLGHYSELLQIVENQQFFNGSMCKTCNFSKYNECLELFNKNIKHINFL